MNEMRHDDPLAATFSSLSPKHQVSAKQQDMKSMLPLAPGQGQWAKEEQSYINPFSISSSKNSEHDSNHEVTAEGFYKNHEETSTKLSATREQESSHLSGATASRNVTPQGKQMSPFDVVL